MWCGGTILMRRGWAGGCGDRGAAVVAMATRAPVAALAAAGLTAAAVAGPAQHTGENARALGRAAAHCSAPGSA
jgi:hypothetical protein